MNYLKEYNRYLKRRAYSPETRKHYLNDLKLFKKSSGKKFWLQISREEVVEFIEEQLKKKCRVKTINRRLYALKGFYRFLSEELELDITIPVRSSHFIRQGYQLPNALEDVQIKSLFSVINAPRDQAIFGLMLRCGLRVAEVTGLQVDQVNLFARELRVLGKGKKERVVPFPKSMIPLLIECLKRRPTHTSFFFWNQKNPLHPLKINSIQRLLKRYGEKAGIEVHCHLLRHTFAKQLTEKGVDRTVLRDLMGHASIKSTDGYGKLSDPFVRESYFKAMKRIIPPE